MLNDRTTYHDISYVHIPAFRIAGTLQKVAGEFNGRPELYIPEAADGLIFNMSGSRLGTRITLLQKLAKLEKEISGTTPPDTQKIMDDSLNSPEKCEHIADKLTDVPMAELVDLQKRTKTALPPRVIAIIVLRDGTQQLYPSGSGLPESLSEPSWLDQVVPMMRDIFSKMSLDRPGNLESVCPRNLGATNHHRFIFDKVVPEISMDPSAVDNRIMLGVLGGGESPRTGSPAELPGAKALAEMMAQEVAKHQLDLVEADPDAAQRVLLVNRQ
jgi:hypothetical protein